MANGKQHRICILGSEASGKTCFIAALAMLGQVQGKKDFVIVAPDDTRTQTWLNSLSRSLTGGHWPPSTTATATYDFMLEYTSVSFHMTIIDYSGEAFRQGFDTLDPESLSDLQQHLFAADTILLLLDPVSDLDVRGTDSAGAEQREQRLSALLNAVLKCIHLDDGGGTEKNLKKNIALLVTKADSIPQEHRNLSPASLIKKAVPKFYSTIRNRSLGLGCFYISAVGGDSSGLAVMPAPPNPIVPEGYDGLFSWLCNCKRKVLLSKIIRWSVRIAVAVVLVLLGLFLYEGHKLSVLRSPTTSEESKIAASKGYILRGGEARVQVGAILKQEIQGIQDSLDQVAALHELPRICSDIERISQYGNNSYFNEISTLFDAINDKGEELHYKGIIAITDPEEQLKAIEEYRKEYSNGKYLDEFTNLGKSAYDKKGESARQSINNIFPQQTKTSFPSFLQKKSAAVDGYRRDYPSDPSSKERMESASKLANILATQRAYDITVKWAEKLNDAPSTIVIVTVNDKEQFRTGTQENPRPNWEHTGRVTWMPGDKVAIEWRYESWLWPDGAIAGLEESALDSLKILSGQTDVLPGDKRDYLDPQQKPKIAFSIEGIDDMAWTDFREFIYPGGYWSK